MTTRGIPESADGEDRRRAFEAVLAGLRFPATRDQGLNRNQAAPVRPPAGDQG